MKYFVELPDFLSEEECDHIIDLAEMAGLESSIMHTDEFQEEHKREVQGNKSYFYLLCFAYRNRKRKKNNYTFRLLE